MIVNLTQHKIVVFSADGLQVVREYQPSGIVARCQVEQAEIANVDGVPVVTSMFGEVTGLPVPNPIVGTTYIVSTMVAQAARRADVVSPDTGPTAVRDADGHIIGVRRFQTF
jgi:hypothetical protein